VLSTDGRDRRLGGRHAGCRDECCNDSRSATGVTAGDTCDVNERPTSNVPQGCSGVSGAGAGGSAPRRICEAAARQLRAKHEPKARSCIATVVTLIRWFAERAQGGWRVREAAPRPSREGDCQFAHSPTAGGGRV